MLALFLLVGSAHAWVTKSQSIYGAQISEIQTFFSGGVVNRDARAQLGYLWDFPSNSSSTRGLGGGITWAMDPALCDLLLAKFREDLFGAGNFVGCNEIKAAISRAFDKWSANSRFIKFLDVTEECEMAGINYGPPNLRDHATQQTGDYNSGGYPHGGCQLAEIWVTSMQGEVWNSATGQSEGHASGRRLDELPDIHFPEHPPTVGEGGYYIPYTEPTSRRQLMSNGKVVHHQDDLHPLPEYGEHARRRMQSEGSGGGTAVATARPWPRWSYDFTYTNGVRPWNNEQNPARSQGVFRRAVVETYAGTFSFNTHTEDICWYLDSFFCAPFHQLKAQMNGASNAELFVNGVTLGLMALGAIFYFVVLVSICMRVTRDITGIEGIGTEDAEDQAMDDEDGDGVFSCGERVFAALRELSHYNPMMLTLFLMVLVVPPLAVTKIFRPCFHCYDFEAAALHEIGHFIGLGHPDNIPDNWAYPAPNNLAWAGPTPGNISYQNTIAQALQRGVRPNASTGENPVCHQPWQAVFAGVPQGADIDASRLNARYPSRNCQMEARTQHNPISCLLDDDLEGLQVMYPDCGPYALYSNVCNNVALNIGLVRTAFYVLIPMIIALAGVITFNSIMHSFERREKDKMKKALKEAQGDLEALKAIKDKSKGKKAGKDVVAKPADVQMTSAS